MLDAAAPLLPLTPHRPPPHLLPARLSGASWQLVHMWVVPQQNQEATEQQYLARAAQSWGGWAVGRDAPVSHVVAQAHHPVNPCRAQCTTLHVVMPTPALVLHERAAMFEALVAVGLHAALPAHQLAGVKGAPAAAAARRFAALALAAALQRQAGGAPGSRQVRRAAPHWRLPPHCSSQAGGAPGIRGADAGQARSAARALAAALQQPEQGLPR